MVVHQGLQRTLGSPRLSASILWGLALVGVTAFPIASKAQNLSDRALYQRCYSKLVREAPQADDPFLPSIEDGTLSGPNACAQLLELAVLAPNGTLKIHPSPARNRIAPLILRTFNDLHASWFTKKQLDATGRAFNATSGVIDFLEPAYFVSRALLDPDEADFSAILTGNDRIRAVRQFNQPDRPIATTADDYAVSQFTNFSGLAYFIPHGPLRGFTTESTVNAPLRPRLRYPEEAQLPNAVVGDVRRHQGGGILGSQSYLLNNLGVEPELLQSNVEKLPRNWAKYIYRDFFCRELPVIELSQARSLTVCNNAGLCGIQPLAGETPLSFRSSQACVQCHASMDQLALLVGKQRAFQAGIPRNNPGNALDEQGTQHVFPHTITDRPSRTGIQAWPYRADDELHRRPAAGRLFFRNIRGTYVNVSVSSFEDLGAAIKVREDFYACAAKRYFAYFTGIDINVNSLSSTEMNALAPAEFRYRDRLLNHYVRRANNLGFMNTRSSLQLVREILAGTEFRQRDFALQQYSQPRTTP